MRIDKFLKLSRIIKRRTEAKKACEGHCIRVNGKIAKAGDLVKPLDRVTISFRYKVLEIEVLEVPQGNIPVSHAPFLYRILKEEKKSID